MKEGNVRSVNNSCFVSLRRTFPVLRWGGWSSGKKYILYACVRSGSVSYSISYADVLCFSFFGDVLALLCFFRRCSCFYLCLECLAPFHFYPLSSRHLLKGTGAVNVYVVARSSLELIVFSLIVIRAACLDVRTFYNDSASCLWCRL